MFPVFIDNLDATTSEYSHYFDSGCHPSLSEVTIKSVEEKLRSHMENQALDTPIIPDRTVKSVVMPLPLVRVRSLSDLLMRPLLRPRQALPRC